MGPCWLTSVEFSTGFLEKVGVVGVGGQLGLEKWIVFGRRSHFQSSPTFPLAQPEKWSAHCHLEPRYSHMADMKTQREGPWSLELDDSQFSHQGGGGSLQGELLKVRATVHPQAEPCCAPHHSPLQGEP